MRTHVHNFSLLGTIGWIAAITGSVAFQILFFISMYRLRVLAFLSMYRVGVNPEAARWYWGFVSSDLVLFGLGPLVTFGVTAAATFLLRRPRAVLKTVVVRAMVTTVWITFGSMAIAFLVAINLWGT